MSEGSSAVRKVRQPVSLKRAKHKPFTTYLRLMLLSYDLETEDGVMSAIISMNKIADSDLTREQRSALLKVAEYVRIEDNEVPR